MTDEARAGISSRLLLGLLVLGLGVMFALDNMGVLDAGRYWPAALVLLGLYKLSQPRGASGRGLGVVLILVGAWLLVDNLRALTSRVGFWPLVLIVAGLALIWEAIRGGRRPWPPLEAGSALEMVAIMGGVERAINSSDFRGGRATAIMGGCEIDLRQASMADEEAVIEVFAIMGGVEIKVPETWSVTVTGLPIMAAIEDKTRQPAERRQLLVVKGVVIMGGVEVKN